jgi:hypothetical protein
VAEDFDFLHRATVQGMGSLLDGGGSPRVLAAIPISSTTPRSAA